MKKAFEQAAKRAAVDRAKFAKLETDFDNTTLRAKDQKRTIFVMKNELSRKNACLDKLALELQTIKQGSEHDKLKLQDITKEYMNIVLISDNQKNTIQQLNMGRDHLIEENRCHKEKIHRLNLKLEESKDNHTILGNELSLKSKLILKLDRKYADLFNKLNEAKINGNQLHDLKYKFEHCKNEKKQMEEKILQLRFKIKEQTDWLDRNKGELEREIINLKNEMAQVRNQHQLREREVQCRQKMELYGLREKLESLQMEKNQLHKDCSRYQQEAKLATDALVSESKWYFYHLCLH